MKPIVLFGTGPVAEVVYYFMKSDSALEVAAFTVDGAYKKDEVFCSLPLVDFERVTDFYPPDQYAMFIAVGYSHMNAFRAQRLADAREKGYEIISYIHPDSGMPGNCTYGENCFIMDKVLIHPFVDLGDNVFVWSGALIGHHSKIGDHCWIASCANIAGKVTVGASCLVAINATVGNGVTIGDKAFLGANTLLTRDLAEGQVLVAESTKPIRLNSQQFFRLSPFGKL